MFYDPKVVSHFKNCGVSILDAPDEVVGTVLLFLNRDPNSERPEDLKAADRNAPTTKDEAKKDQQQ